MNQPLNPRQFHSLGGAFGWVSVWYLDQLHNHVHAALALTCDDVEAPTSEIQEIRHFAYVEHSDGQRQLIATLIPKQYKGEALQGTYWEITLADLHNPEWLILAFRSRGCGPERLTLSEARGAFKLHAICHHNSVEPEFVKTGPGRITVRRPLAVGGWAPYGLILDARLIRGEKVFNGDNDQNELNGIDIFG
jgi:hypothetical protein